MSVFMALPMSEWLYRKMYRIKYGEEPPARDENAAKEGEAK